MLEEFPKDKEPRRRGLNLKGKLRNLLPRHEELPDYATLERQRLDNTPAGPGLKKYDLDSNLFQYSTDQSYLTSGTSPFFKTFDSILKEHLAAHPETRQQSEVEQEENPFEAVMFSSFALSRATPELENG